MAKMMSAVGRVLDKVRDAEDRDLRRVLDKVRDATGNTDARRAGPRMPKT